MLVDSNGRLILNSTLDVTNALVWNEDSGIIDVNSEGRYNTQLTEWMTNFGESQYSYIFNQTNQYTIIADSDEEDIQFNDENGEWNPTVSEYIAIPIPVEGDVQIFSDAACTSYADGTQADVYARINVNVPINTDKQYQGTTDPNDECQVYAELEEPHEYGSVTVWVDWHSEDIVGGFTPGTVVKCSNNQPFSEPQPQLSTVFGA